MSLVELLFGRPLRSEEETTERVGALLGIPLLGLDALASAAYGPEAALTVLLPLGAAASPVIVPIGGSILAVLLVVFLSYRQTIAAYPGGGGSFTVASENLGRTAGLLAGSALATDYVLNVAVAISAGVGAIVSVAPPLLPHTLELCLAILALLTMVNLRGVRTAGLAWLAPTYLFVTCLGLTILIGLVKSMLASDPATAPSAAAATPLLLAPGGAWLMVRAFASGCTAMTGVEAVSNAVPVFREPTVAVAHRTLTSIVAILAMLLAGVAILSTQFHITATLPGQTGYESVLSQMVGAVAGHGPFYLVTMGAVLAVLALSANTSYADFPRVCRMLALDGYLPVHFAHRGRRLVYSHGIVLLALLSGALLIAFGGITDHLIPLFAVGAFLAFTLSQLGMVAHWRRSKQRRASHAMFLNAAGALATGAALGIIIVAKFWEGAWLTVLVIPGFVVLFGQFRRYHDRLERQLALPGPVDMACLSGPVVVIPLRRLDRVSRKALRFALTISSDIYAVQIVTGESDSEDVAGQWPDLVERPARAAGHIPPSLVVVHSAYREYLGPLLGWIRQAAVSHPDRYIAVIIPEIARRRWYHFLVSHRATLLKTLLLLRGGPQIVVINTPWYLEDHEPVTPR